MLFKHLEVWLQSPSLHDFSVINHQADIFGVVVQTQFVTAEEKVFLVICLRQRKFRTQESTFLLWVACSVDRIGKMVKEEESCCSVWTREQEKAFENALATHPEDCGDRWEKIAAGVPGKSIEDIRHHYELLVEDIDDIESGRVPVPSYLPVEGGGAKKGGNSHGDPSHGGRTSRSDQERRKGIAWTEDEHRWACYDSAYLEFMLMWYCWILITVLFLWGSLKSHF